MTGDEEISLKVSKLKSTIMLAEAELSELRKGCNHPQYYIGLWSWRVGNIQPSRICNVCHIDIPGITDKEIEDMKSDSTASSFVSFTEEES